MAGTGGKGGGKGGKGGSAGASNADLQDDEDLMARRRLTFGKWKVKRQKNTVIDYVNSPAPPKKFK